MFIVVLRVIHIANTAIAIGNNKSVNHPVPDNPSIAIKPIRAEWAADNTNSNTGTAQINPHPDAKMQILPTIICIWRATKLSDAPI